jgi:hypothetical protein
MMNGSANEFTYSFLSEEEAINLAQHHTNYIITSFSSGLLFIILACYHCPLITTLSLGIGSIILSLLSTLIYIKCMFDEISNSSCPAISINQILTISAYLFIAAGSGLLATKLLATDSTPLIKILMYSFWAIGMLLLVYLHFNTQKKKAFLFFIQSVGAIFLLIGALQAGHYSKFLPSSGSTLTKLNWSIFVFATLAGGASFLLTYIDDQFFKGVTLRRRFTFTAEPFIPRRLTPSDDHSISSHSNHRSFNHE